MTSRWGFRFLSAMAMLLILAACPPHRVDFGKDGEAKTASGLLKRVELTENSVISIKGDGKLGIDAPAGKGSVTLFVAVVHPASIHIEQLDFFGRPQGVLTTDGENFGLYDGAAGKFFRGPASAANLGRFLPLVIPPRELASLMMGRAPRIPYENATMSFDAERKVYLLKLTRGSVVQNLEVEPGSHRVLKSVITGLNTYDVEFADVETRGAISLPHKVILNAPQAKTRVELTWKDIAINEPPDLTMFDMTPLENVPVVDVDAEGRAVAPQ